LITIIGQVRYALAQYSFESKPAIKYKAYKKWKVVEHSETNTDYSIIIPNFFADHQSIGIKISGNNEKDRTRFFLLKGNKPVCNFIDSLSVSAPSKGFNPQAAFVEDINGDGLKDLKVTIPFYGGCGGFNFYAQIIYFFQQPDGSLKAFSFSDWMDNEGFPNRPERDFDADRNFEIITKTFQSYGRHNYELYNLYSFGNGKLINVNKKADYPILIQLLWGPNYTLTNKVTKERTKKLSKRLPDDFKQITLK
jgi:hypothetical protein